MKTSEKHFGLAVEP